jgi:hypothetical protein
MTKRRLPAVIMGALLVLGPNDAGAQQNLAERLGYDADAKLLIVHADDIGMARAVNGATARDFESRGTWCVAVDSELYVRAYNSTGSNWYQAAVR